ncbi:MAG: hypothetical protein AAGH60_06775 [Pseudomonadota bacterium]
MITLTKTMTLTSLAVIVAILAGMWMATTQPATSGTQSFEPTMSVETRLGAAGFDLCEGQTWPHFSNGCVSWISAGEGGQAVDRSVSIQITDPDHGFTVVSKAQPISVASR